MKKQVLVKNHRGQKQTHKPPSLRGLIFAILSIILLLPLIGKSQNSCSTAENDSPGSNTQGVTRFFTGNDYWLTFVGDSIMNYYIQTSFVDSLLIQDPMQISLYRGGCNDLTLVKTDSMSMTYDSLQTGSNYYVKIHSKQDSIYFRLFTSFFSKNLATNCDSTECDILRNGNFTYMDPMVTGSNSHDPFWLINWICRWGSIGSHLGPRRHPSATTSFGALDNGFAYMWTRMVDSATSQQYDWNEVISQVTFIPQGTYDVSLAYKKTDTINLPADHLLMNIVPGNVSTVLTTFNGTILNAPTLAIDVQNIDNYFNWEYHTNEYTIPQSGIYTVEVLPFNTQNQGMVSWVSIDNIHITPKPTAQILTSFCKPVISLDCVLNGCHPIDHIIWDFGDGTSFTTAQGETIGSHNYIAGGSYTVTATIFYRIYNSPAIASITQTTVVNIVEGMESTLDVAGNRNSCDTITSYTTINSFTGTNCTWTITPANAGTIIANNNHTVTINWHEYNMTNGQPVTLTLNDSLCSKSINIWKCCKDATGVAPLLSDESITSNLTSGTYYLNGIITIEGGVTIAGVVFNMAPEAKIVLKSPTTFNVNTSTLKAGCNYMWDGIYSNSPHCAINMQSSTIQDAENAIMSDNGGYISVSNTLFNLNNNGIKVVNSNVPNSLFVSNCKFYCTTDGTGTTPRNLIAPLSTSRGSAGIYINNVSSIQVGDINKATKNKFSYTDCGIIIGNSNANIYNNIFVNFPVYNFIGHGYGININGKNSIVRSVNIGGYNSGNNIYTNLFSNCYKGIVQEQQAANIRVLCDTFTNCTVSATEISLNNNRNIDFTKNRIQNTVNGLLINDFINTRLVVDSNSLYNVVNGIFAKNATSQECYGATIRKNVITGTFNIGIHLANVKSRSLIPIGPPGYERQIPYIYGNTITFGFGSYNLSGTTDYMGIYITNGYDTYIEDNVVNTPTYTVANLTQGLKLNGINVFFSPKTTLCSNTITNLGMGICMEGLCSVSTLKSNSMNNNYYGVRLNSATIGNQGVTAVRWVNRNWWNTPFVAGRYRVQGIVATATTWTYDYSQITTNYTLLSSNSEYSVSGAFTSTAITSPVPQTCPGFDGVIWIPYSGGGGGGGDAMINESQSGELATMPTFTVDVEENQYYQASAFYANAQTENLNMSVSEDAELIDNPIQTTSIPQFDQINKLISANRIDEAIAVNDAIVPKNLIEKNHKIANCIYLQSWAKGRLELTDDERATLLQIATQPHIQGGYGVITAWVMLNRVYRTESVKPKNIIKPFGIYNNETTIYPNPAREQVTVDGASEVFCVVIYDLQGRELIKTTNVPNSSKLTINTSKLTKGIYLITLIDKELSVIVSEKLVID